MEEKNKHQACGHQQLSILIIDREVLKFALKNYQSKKP